MSDIKHKDLLDKLRNAYKDVNDLDLSSSEVDITLLTKVANAMLHIDMAMAKDIAVEIFGPENADLDKHIWKMYETLGREKFLVSYISALRQSYSKDDALRKGEQVAANWFGPKGSGSIFN